MHGRMSLEMDPVEGPLLIGYLGVVQGLEIPQGPLTAHETSGIHAMIGGLTLERNHHGQGHSCRYYCCC